MRAAGAAARTWPPLHPPPSSPLHFTPTPSRPPRHSQVLVPGALGRVLIQLELAPRRQRLTFSLISLNADDLGEIRLRYTFAIGLACAALLDAESHCEPYFEFAEWRGAERGALAPPEGLPPASSVERRARAFVDFFASGEGGQPPIAPRAMPPASAFSVHAHGAAAFY